MDKKKKKTPTFARAPFATQVFNKDTREKFDKLPDWQRTLMQKVIEHGNLSLAAEQAGIANRFKEVDFDARKNQSIPEALNEAGLTSLELASHLRQCLEAKTYKVDKQGNPVIDLKTKLKALELIFRLRGDFESVEPVKDTRNILEMFEENEPK